jgi:hypothetical protein
MNGRAIALKGLKRLDEAAASCAQALAIKPDHLGAMVTQGHPAGARELRRRDPPIRTSAGD